MGRALDRHRIANKYSSDLDLMMGDSEQTAMATGAISELLKTAGGIAAQEQAKKETAKRAQDMKNAQANLKKAQDNMSYVEATEKNKNGPLHKKAKEALDVAQAEVERVMASLPMEMQLAQKPLSQQYQAQPSGRPWWVYGLAGVGVLGAGLIGYKLLRRK